MKDGAGLQGAGKGAPARGLAQRVADGLTSLRFAVALVVLIALACIAGTLGLTRVYHSWWFVGLLGLLAASLAVCTYRRCRVAGRAQGGARGRALGSILTHVSLLLILAGGVVRVLTGLRGQLAFREGETRDSFIVDGKPRPLPFAVRLKKFEIELHEPSGAPAALRGERLVVAWPDKHLLTTLPVELDKEQRVAIGGGTPREGTALRVTVRRRMLDFEFDRASREARNRSDEPRNPAVLVESVFGASTNSQWLFAMMPDFRMHAGDGRAAAEPPYKLTYEAQAGMAAPPQVKAYKSTLEIIERGASVLERVVEVNAPLGWRGYRFYQSGYDPRDPRWTSLQVVRDPGVPLVYAGFVLMIAGLIVVFYVYPIGPAAKGTAPPPEEDV